MRYAGSPGGPREEMNRFGCIWSLMVVLHWVSNASFLLSMLVQSIHILSLLNGPLADVLHFPSCRCDGDRPSMLDHFYTKRDQSLMSRVCKIVSRMESALCPRAPNWPASWSIVAGSYCPAMYGTLMATRISVFCFGSRSMVRYMATKSGSLARSRCFSSGGATANKVYADVPGLSLLARGL